MVQFRKSKKIGPFRLTASKSGISVSGGVKGARVSTNSKGEVRRTLSAPGTGIYDTKRVGSNKRQSHAEQTAGGSDERDVTLQVIDATRGTRALLSNTPGVTSAQVVEVSNYVSAVADFTGIVSDNNGYRRGIRDAVLTPEAGEVQCIVLATIADNETHFLRKEKRNPDDAAPKGIRAGRLNKRSAVALIDQIGERSVQAVVYIDATSGQPNTIEARWFAEDLLNEEPPPPSADSRSELTLPPPPLAKPEPVSVAAPNWYPDPNAPQGHLRYWDGNQWTSWRSDGAGRSWSET